MHITKKIALLTGLLLPVVAAAAPFNPAPFAIDNKGDKVNIQHLGDEHFSYYQTTDGRLIDKDSTGCYYYLGEDGRLSGVKVREQQTADESEFLQNTDNGKVMQSYSKLHPLKHMRPDNEPYEPKAWAKGAAGTSVLKNLPKGQHCKGTNLRFPVLLVAGTGTENCDTNKLSDQLNQKGYNQNKHYGSVRDYFISVSDGIFAPTFDIYTVRINNQLSSYTEKVGQLLKEAIEQLSINYPDFDGSLYDADNDGEIDALAVLYAGTENQANGLGGFHYELKWYSQGRQPIGGKKANNFLILSQMKTSTELLPICSFIHEFSHCMGLKDHYSVKNKPETFTTQYPGAHAWDVMSTGMYNNGGGCPPGYSAFEKEFMGWIKPVTLTESDGTTMLPPLNETGQAYKLTVSNDEYFLLENRQLTGWDASLPSHGMLIWHIDYNEWEWTQDIMNDEEDHQRVDIVEAGNLAVTSYYDGFEKKHLIDDPYPGSQNVTFFDRFQSWNGDDLGIVLYKIAEIDHNIYFTTKKGVEINTHITNATLTKTGNGKESQRVEEGKAIEEFGYEWTEARDADITGLPNGINVIIDTINKTIRISGAPTETGIFNFKVYTIGASTNATSEGTITVTPRVDTLKFDYQIELPLSDNYAPFLLDITNVFDSLGIKVSPDKLYFTEYPLLEEFAIDPIGNKISEKTANDPGQWFDKDGSVCEYYFGSVYAEYDLAEKLAKIGHYPDRVGANEQFDITQAFAIKNKMAILSYHIKTIDTTNASAPVLTQAAQVSLNGNRLDIKSLADGQKTLSIINAAGQTIYRDTFYETEKTLVFDKTEHIIVVVVEGEKQKRLTFKGAIE